MNEKFFSLPPEKQQAILNAGYRVFSQNSYKKSPMQEIADTAGISKSLLFYYFKNKQELYMYLWDNCARLTIKSLTESGCYEQTDLFEMMYRGMRAKMLIIKRYPYVAAFVMKAYYEKDPDVCPEIQKSFEKYKSIKANNTLINLDPEQFIPGIDLNMMYREMYLASEGYLWEKVQQGNINFDLMEKDFIELIDFWKKIYLRKDDGKNECN